MLIAGNWKMNGLRSSLGEVQDIAEHVDGLERKVRGQMICPNVLICPPATLISAAAEQTSRSNLAIGAQVVSAIESGAYTGDISAEMVADLGATYTIVGHSERRMGHGETDADVAAAARQAQNCKLHPIICCGESLEAREAGAAIATVTRQLTHSLTGNLNPMALSVAYEPIWAIGTGKAATPEDIASMHSAIREHLISLFGDDGSAIDILYGGSVNGKNSIDILAIEDVGGALVGGASLKASSFIDIIETAYTLAGQE